MPNKFYTLITGASEGFGKALALECASRNMNLVLVALQGPELNCLENFIKRNYEVDVVCIAKDLCQDDACYEVFCEVQNLDLQVNMLLNNAGLGSTVYFEEGSPGFYEKQIKLNVLATTVITRHFLSMLKRNSPSYIMNVGSMASFFCLPKKMVYAATKSFVYTFSRTLRQEVKKDAVSVSVLCPGGMSTNLSLTLMIKSSNYFTRLTAMSPEIAAPIALDGLLRKKEVIIPGRLNNCLLVLYKLLPGWVKTLLMRRAMNGLNTQNRFSKYLPQPLPVLHSAQVA